MKTSKFTEEQIGRFYTRSQAPENSIFGWISFGLKSPMMVGGRFPVF
jgi:hypothetical protein